MTVSILIDGVEYEPLVHYPTARFVSQVNGIPGECELRIRDDTSSLSFTPGMSLQLLIDGAAVWTGYVMAWHRTYVGPAMNTGETGLQRVIDLTGVDINVLFTRRIVFDQLDGANILAPLYPPATADTTAIGDLVDGWLDLSGDGIDTSSLVEHVGDINVDQDARAWEGADTWGQAMASIASIPAAIYYIDPDRNLVFTDVDTPNAPYVMSDVVAPGVAQYREMEILQDGGGLVNDLLAWGFGYGSMTPVFKRKEDATSQSIHGLWQAGSLNNGIYKQATIDRIADSVVIGSPQSKRGSRNDRVSVQIATYTNGFRPAQKIDFTSEVFGFNDVIPIRKMEVTFEALVPKFTLTLSHEIDTPFNFFDPFIDDLSPIKRKKIKKPGHPQTEEDQCECGITDSFSRTVSGGWGVSDSGLAWDTGGDPDFGVTPNHGYLDTTQGSGSSATLPGLVVSGTLDMRMSIRSEFVPNSGDDSMLFDIEDDGNGNAAFLVAMGNDPAGGDANGLTVYGSDGSTSIQRNGWAADTWYSVRWQYEPGGESRLKVWLETDPEPSSWDVVAGNSTGPEFTGTLYVGLTNQTNSGTFDSRMSVDEIDIPGNDRCSAPQFDDFERTVGGNSWGTATPSGAVWHSIGPGIAQRSVDGTAGVFNQASSNSIPGSVGGQAFLYTEDALTAYSGDFILNAQFKVTSQTSTSASSQALSVTDFANGFSLHQSVFIQKNVGGTSGNDKLAFIEAGGGGTADVAKTWTVGTLYNLKWQKDGSTHRVKTWQDGTPEPSSWDIQITGIGTITVDRFAIFTSRATSGAFSNVTWGMSWSYLDFEYEGRPCYYNCTSGGTTHVIDSFSRSVATGWGIATSGGTWSKTASVGTTTEDVDGDYGLIHYASTTPGASTRWTLPLPSWFSGATVVEWRTLMKTAIKTPLLGLYTSAETTGMEIQITTAGATKIVNYGTFQSSTHSTNTSSFNWVDNAPFWVALKLDSSGNVYFKGWLASDPEPASWQGPKTGASLTPGNIAKFLTSIGQVSAVSGDYGITYSEVRIPDSSCSPVMPTQSLRTDVSGRGCQNAIRINSTEYQVGSPYLPKSTLVYENGLLQRRGVDYEETGPTTITFTDPIGSSSSVRICYYISLVIG